MDLTVSNLFQKRSLFNLTHSRTLSCYMGKLIPILLEEVVPGDSFRVQSEMLVRLAPLVAPIMHEVNVYTHFFFVPARLLQTDWEPFITGGDTGADTTPVPTINSPASTGWAEGSLADYFGLPIGVPDLTVLAYPFRAYNLIYNEWYRDEWLQSKVTISKGNGNDTTTSTALLKRNWEKDYFTSSLPSPQKGPAAYLPLGTSAPLSATQASIFRSDQNATGLYRAGTGTTMPDGDIMIGSGDIVDASTGNIHGYVDVASHIKTDLSGITTDLTAATAATINDLRQSWQLQKWMERNARGGSRYPESNLAHFGVRSSDARLQRPEYLGGGSSSLMISEVLQTSKTDGSPQGNMAGHAVSGHQTHGFIKSFEEHGYIIGILSIMPRTVYTQGVPRMWSRFSRLEFYWPEFSTLGEQAVLNKEIYAAAASPSGVWGYVPRYEELRRRENSVHGLFRLPSGSGGLDYWHMARIFGSEPDLNGSFIESDPTMRCQAITNQENCYVQIVNHVSAIRPIPAQGTPGLVDHH